MPAKHQAGQSSLLASGLAMAGAISTTVANFGLAILVGVPGNDFAGIFFAATALITILGNASGLGSMTAIIYFLPQARDRDDPNPRDLLRVALRPVVALSVAIGVLVALVWLFLGRGTNGTLSTFLVLSPVVPALAITASLGGATRGLGTMTPTVAINQVFRPIGQLTLLGLLVALVDEPTPAQASAAWAIPILIGTAAFVLATRRLGGFVHRGPAHVTGREFWTYARPRAASSAMQIALERLDVVLVQLLAGDAAAGLYGKVTRFVTAGNFLGFSVAQAVSPNLRRAVFRAKESGHRLANSDASTLLKQVTSWLVLILWPYFLFVATKATFLTGFLDATEGATALTIIAVGMLAASFAGPVDLALTMTGKSKLSMYSTGLALTTDVLLSLLLIPLIGMNGAAIAWAVAVWLQKLYSTIMLRRTSGLIGPGEPAVRAALISLAAVIPVSLLTGSTSSSVLIAVVIAASIYLPAVWAQRDFFGLSRSSRSQ